jgi:hypothetical protein
MLMLFILVCISSFGLIGRAQNDFLRQFEGMFASNGIGLNQLPPGMNMFSSDFTKDFTDEVCDCCLLAACFIRLALNRDPFFRVV